MHDEDIPSPDHQADKYERGRMHGLWPAWKLLHRAPSVAAIGLVLAGAGIGISMSPAFIESTAAPHSGIAGSRSTAHYSEARSGDCDVQILEPGPGARVLDTGLVRGAVRDLPSDAHLWGFVSPIGDPRSWAIGPAQFTDSSTQWTLRAHYGEPGDHGGTAYAVAVVAVPTDTHRELLSRLAAHEFNQPFIGKPARIKGCEPVEIRVRKARQNQ